MVGKQKKNLYKRIVLCGIQSLNAAELRRLQSFSVQSIQLLADQQALRSLDGHAVECLIISLNIKITSEELEHLPNLKTIVVFGSSTYDVNVKLVERSRLKLLNVLDYCDRETAEFVIGVVCGVATGATSKLAPIPRKSFQDQTVGVIGAGPVGMIAANFLLDLGFNVLCYSRNPRPDARPTFVEKRQLLVESEIIVVAIAPYVRILSASDFAHLKNCKAIVNISLGNVIDKGALRAWLRQGSGYLFLDAVASRYFSDMLTSKNIVNCGVPAFRTRRSRNRLHERVLQLVEESLEDHDEDSAAEL